MKIAVTVEGNKVSERCGKPIKFMIFEVLKGQLKGKLLVNVSTGGGQEALIYVLKNEGAEVLLCGEISEFVRTELQKYDIKVISGLRGNVHSLIRAYAKGALKEA